MLYKNNSCKALIRMLNSIDDLGCVKDAGPRGELRPGDLTFLDTQNLGDDGCVYVVKVKGHTSSEYYRLYHTGDTITLKSPESNYEFSVHSPEDVKIEGKVTGIYREFAAAPMVDLREHARLFEQIESISPGPYSNDYGAVEDAIRARFSDNVAFCMWEIFKWGFLKGQRAEKARAKKQRRESAKKMGGRSA